MGAESAAQSGYLVDIGQPGACLWSIFHVWIVPGNVSFWEDNEICFVRGRLADKADSFGDGSFGIEEYRSDVASYQSINTPISCVRSFCLMVETHPLP